MPFTRLETQLDSQSPIVIFAMALLIPFLSFGGMDPLATFGDDYNSLLNGFALADHAFKIGRWSNVLIWFMTFDNGFMFPFSLFYAFVVLTLSGFLLCKLFEIKSAFQTIMATGLVSTSPFLLDVLTFKMRHFSLTTGILLATFSVWLFFEYRKPFKYVILFATIIFAIGIYPGNIAIIATIFLIRNFLHRDSWGRRAWRHVFSFSLIGLLSVVAFVAITVLLIKITGVDRTNLTPNYNIAGNYVDGVGALVSNIGNATSRIFGFWFFENVGIPLLYSWLIFSAFSLSAAIVLLQRQGRADVLAYAVPAVLLIALPFVALMVPMVRANFPSRYGVLLPLGFLAPTMLVCALSWLRAEQVGLRFALYGLCALALVIVTMSNNREVYKSNLLWQNSVLLAARADSFAVTSDVYKENVLAGRRTRLVFVDIGEKGNLRRQTGSGLFRRIGGSIHDCNIAAGCQMARLTKLYRRMSVARQYELKFEKGRKRARSVAKGSNWRALEGAMIEMDGEIVIFF